MTKIKIVVALLILVPCGAISVSRAVAFERGAKWVGERPFATIESWIYEPAQCALKCREAAGLCGFWNLESPPPGTSVGAKSTCTLLSGLGGLRSAPDRRFASGKASDALPGETDGQCLQPISVFDRTTAPRLNPGACQIRCRGDRTCTYWSFARTAIIPAGTTPIYPAQTCLISNAATRPPATFAGDCITAPR